MKKTALLALIAIAVSGPSIAKSYHYRHFHREASKHRDTGNEPASSHAHITCEMVRTYVAEVCLVQAKAIAEAVRQADPSLVLLCLAGSRMIDVSRAAGVTVAEEAFADRAYAADGSLVSRSIAGSVLTDPAAIAARAVRMVVDGEVEAHGGGTVRLRADSLCVHGDTPGALDIVRAVRQALTSRGLTLAPFAHD